MIKIKELSKVYLTPSQKITALDNVSLTVEKGEIFGIIGLSGAGKSTLIRCINMLEKPTMGSIVVDGQEITSLAKRELRTARQKIGMIFQHFNLLSSRTVFANVMFPLEIAKVPRPEAARRARELLELVGLADKEGAFPSQLSGGQKQRVGIARALANGPKLLLSDEATSALDPQTTRSILKLLRDINRKFNLTILLITHDMNVIKEICDRVAVIDNSHIVEVGEVLKVFASPSSPTARSFVNTVISREVPAELLHRSQVQNEQTHVKLIRVSFIGPSAGAPVISSMIRQFDIEANILYGNVDRIKDTPFGNLALELIGPPGVLQESMDYLRSRGLEIEVLNNA
ncbi:Methionine import ATP-binding protein MetN [Sporotomaculum syntrophicum]|uniref:Methionine import ATP-binding protein MetN n=1 Tax=Sporotomaculum syntrophicum TaxID=182264 RepID=A0A9D2WPT5_9FIRM|nr:methionine ABC transporter ATP-binding protein [Sporotomaculum syntrophicum]KAF1084397.1 Methionine import ATP-binding protein MetN [Sporotomaculum syntrophicum]